MDRWIGRVEQVLMFLAAACMFVMMVLTTFDMLSRKFFHVSIPSLFEFTEDYLMVGLVFLSLSYVYKIGGHIRIDLLEKYIPELGLRVWTIIHKIMAIVLFLLIAVEGWDAAVEAHEFNTLSSSLLAYPMAPALMMVPIGSGMLALRIALSLFVAQPEQPDAADLFFE
ncbi:TRAP transporter small permease [Ottowia pentelensis]